MVLAQNCGIFLQLSCRVRFCCVLHSFFSDGLYSFVFRSVYFWNNLISVYVLFLDLHFLN